MDSLTVLKPESTSSSAPLYRPSPLSPKKRTESFASTTYTLSYEEFNENFCEQKSSPRRSHKKQIAIQQTVEPKKLHFNKGKYFQSIRRQAIAHLFEKMQLNLLISLRRVVCFEEEYEKVQTPDKIFRWSEEDFHIRRCAKNTAWINLVLIQLSRHCIETKKQQVDIKEIINYVKLLSDEFKGQETNCKEKLQSAYDYLNLFKAMQKSSEDLSKMKESLALAYFTNQIFNEGINSQTKKMNELEFVLFKSDVLDPIQVRYQIRYYNLAVEQFNEWKLMEQNTIRKQIEDIEKKMQVELYCSAATIHALSAESRTFKDRIKYMDALYAKKFDDIGNEISYKRLKMDKMHTQMMYLEEQIARFREETAQIRLMQAEEAERLAADEQKRHKIEQREEAKLRPKKNKKGKSKSKYKKE